MTLHTRRIVGDIMRAVFVCLSRYNDVGKQISEIDERKKVECK